MFQKKPTFNMDVNAAWSEDGEYSLIVQYSFRPKTPDQPYFNAHDAEDWSIKCMESNSNLRNTNSRKLIASWTNDSRDGGGIMQNQMYWLRVKKRIIYTESQIPTLYEIDNKKRVELRPPQNTIIKLVGKELAAGVSGFSPTPSPDGKSIAVWFNTSYIKGGPLGPQIHTHFISFFNSSNGKHLKSNLLPFKDKELDPWLQPKSGHPSFRNKFLWRKDSSGVYVISKKQSWIVNIKPETELLPTTQVPRYSVATTGGVVSKEGVSLYLKSNKSTPNKTSIQKRKIPAWVPFKQIPLVEIDSIDYAKP